jgi:hypothetical protein
MAAPAYTWTYVNNIHGYTTPPKVTVLDAAASLETLSGTLLAMSSGQVIAAGNSVTTIIGLAEIATAAPASSHDPVKVMILRPGDVIQGTANATAAGSTGAQYKTSDLQADGRLDVSDTTNGSLSVLSCSANGLTVNCVVESGAII